MLATKVVQVLKGLENGVEVREVLKVMEETILEAEERLAQLQISKKERQRQFESERKDKVSAFRRIDECVKVILEKNCTSCTYDKKRVYQLLRKLVRCDEMEKSPEILENIERWSQTAKDNVELEPLTALGPFIQMLDALDGRMGSFDVSLSVRDLLQKRIVYLFGLMKVQIDFLLKECLREMGWPQPLSSKTVYSVEDMFVHRFDILFRALSRMHVFYLMHSDLFVHLNNLECKVLWPLKLLVDPIEERFLHHFGGDQLKDTLDKPEWLFAFASSAISLHLEFVKGLHRFIEEFDWLPQYRHWFTFEHHFISSITDIVSGKVEKRLTLFISEDSQALGLFRKYVDGLIEFDTMMHQTYNWKGNALEILTQTNLFDAWIQVEKVYLQQQLDAIISLENGNDASLQGVILIKLFKNLTKRWEGLPSLSCQLEFIDLIQLKILSIFSSYLEEKLHNLFSSIKAVSVFSEEGRALWECIGVTASVTFYCVEEFEVLALEESFTKIEVEGGKNVLDRSIKSFRVVMGQFRSFMREQVVSQFMQEIQFYHVLSEERLDDFSVSSVFKEAELVLCEQLRLLQLYLSASLFKWVLISIASELSQKIFQKLIENQDIDPDTGFHLIVDCKSLFNVFSAYNSSTDLFPELLDFINVYTHPNPSAFTAKTLSPAQMDRLLQQLLA